MTVRINKPALNLREELTKAQGVVRYEQRQLWMDGLVENGTFDNDTSGWESYRIATLSNVSGELQIVNDPVNAGSSASQEITTVAGKTYVLTGTITYNSSTTGRIGVGSGSGSLGGSDSYDLAHLTDLTTGDFTASFTAKGSSTWVVLSPQTLNATIRFDNIAVFEVDENDNVIHSVPLGFKPVHVYEDGLLQREGENHDYTVVDTGFEYQVKPTVAPSATTETCVIAEREL